MSRLIFGRASDFRDWSANTADAKTGILWLTFWIFLLFVLCIFTYLVFCISLYFVFLFSPDCWANRSDAATSCWWKQTDSQSRAEKAGDCLTNITNAFFWFPSLLTLPQLSWSFLFILIQYHCLYWRLYQHHISKTDSQSPAQKAADCLINLSPMLPFYCHGFSSLLCSFFLGAV